MFVNIPMSGNLHGLNESQKKAVTTTEGPVIVIAGPGTGKTLTIVHRIAYLINQGIKPENILAVTFTNRAAREMMKRTEALLGRDASKVFIGTFHLLGLMIIKDAFTNSFVIIDREEQTNLLKTLLKGLDLKIQQVADKISRIKNLIDEVDERIKEIYEKYQSALTEKSALDFDDLILKPIDILSNEKMSEKYRNTFKYIMVDEYQDINPAQYKLLTLLTRGRANLCVIGDSDQAIYAFRGADVTNFLNFKKTYKDTQVINLIENYRSTGIIIDSSNSLIKNNPKRIAREIKPTKGKGIPISIISVPDEKSEGEVIIGEIEQRMGGTSHYQLMHKVIDREITECSYKFADFAVIFRTNIQAKTLEESFTTSGIPYQVIGKAHQLKRNEIVNALKERSAELKVGLCLEEFLNTVLEESGLVAKYKDSDIMFLQDLASRYRDMKPSEALISFINELSLLTPADAYDPRADVVTLTTLHMAKGLEFRVVFITGVEEGLIPYAMKKDNINIEEERRLFYVGMTRAIDELFLIHARNRFLYGQNLVRLPSPFIMEITQKFLDNKFIPDRVKKQKEDRQIGLF